MAWLLTPRGVVVFTLALAALIRLWSVGSAPLIITNDGHGYLKWAQMLSESGVLRVPPFRTPGYPVFLSGVFAVFGFGPTGVVIAQQALGVAVAGLLAWLGCRIAGPRWGLLAGVLGAIDPVQIVLSHYALTEPLLAALLVVAFALMLGTRRRWPVLIAVGITLGLLVLVKPTFQVMVPFFTLAAALSGAHWRQRLARPAILAACALATVLPWMGRVHSRYGSWRVAESTSAVLFFGMGQAQLLSEDSRLPPAMQASYDRLVRNTPGDAAMHVFFTEIDGWKPANARLMTDWAIRSVKEQPARYARAAVYALLWQFDIFPASGHVTNNEMSWYARRLAAFLPRKDGLWPNIQTSGFAPGMEYFGVTQRPGVITRFFHWWGTIRQPGLARLPLFACFLGAGAWCVWRRRFVPAVLIAGTVAYMAAHAAVVLYSSRYSAPCWALWPLGPALVAGLWQTRPRRETPAVQPTIVVPGRGSRSVVHGAVREEEPAAVW